MDTNFVVLAPMEEQDLPLEWTRDHLIAAAKGYLAVVEKAKQLLPTVDDSLLSGTPGTIYLKKKGHRLLSAKDSENIIQTLGTDEDKLALKSFSQAQQNVSERLKKTKRILDVMEESGIIYMTYSRRLARPELWPAEDIIKVVETLKRLNL